MRKRYNRKGGRGHADVELNMAAMLDMAFQLLAFFILTFRPSAVEAQVSLRMPPAKAIGGEGGVSVTDPVENLDEKPQIPLSVVATPDGEIARIDLGSRSISGQQPLKQVMAGLNDGLREMIAAGNFDGVALQASRGLLYERLMQVLDVCTNQTLKSGEPLTKVSISETGGGPE